MERNLISTCQVCDCTRCARQNNCPNEEAACGECTPTNRHGIALITCQW